VHQHLQVGCIFNLHLKVLLIQRALSNRPCDPTFEPVVTERTPS
jgi:hypothetical protein